MVKIVEQDYGIEINRQDFNYSRFVTHMHYLIKRAKSNEQLVTDNGGMYEHLVKEYPKNYETSKKVREYISTKIGLQLSDEEMLYLMLHINRLCTREDCNQ